MKISETNLSAFRTWGLERGRQDGTLELYVTNIRTCAADPRGLTHRLVSGVLAPNTLRTNLAALRAWAVFSQDAALSKRLADIRLPPARRVRVKVPLDLAAWKKVIHHLKTCRMRSEAMRQVLLIMALRGFRSGDVLRMRRTELTRALATGKLVYEGKGRKRLEFSATPIRPQLEALVAFPKWDRVRDLISKSTTTRVLSKKVCRAAQKTARQVGVSEMNPHRYRHTFATQYLERLRGDPNALLKLKQYMGWESIATAARYVDSVSQDELDAIGADLVAGLLE